MMKTIIHRMSLNDMVITDAMCANNLYSALYLEDLDNIRIHQAIINEDVLRDNVLQDLFDKCTLKNRTLMSVEEVMNHLPIGSTQYKILKRSSLHTHKLYVDICDFSATNFFLELKYFSKDKIENNVLISKSIELNTKLTEHIDGGFITFDNHKEFGILFLNSKIGVNMSTFKHEMIHYFNWVQGAFKNIESADKSFYENEIKAIHDNVNDSFTGNDLTYMTSSNEYDSLLNDFLDLLKNVKEKYFNEMSGYNFAKMIVNIIEYRKSYKQSESLDEYFKRLKSHIFFNDVKTKTAFTMVIFFMLINYKVTNIKNHIFGAFSI